MKLRLTILATLVAALAVPAAASAATLEVDPQRACYGSGQVVSLLGTGFTPDRQDGVEVTRDGERVGPLDTDGTGAFNGSLTLGQQNGRRTSTYTATDVSDPMLTASTQITVTETDVRLRPRSGAPGRRVRVNAIGFTIGGQRLWAHVTRRERTRNLLVGRLEGPCRRLSRKRRLLPRNARVGVYSVQFDTFREYVKGRRQSVTYTISVRRVRRPS